MGAFKDYSSYYDQLYKAKNYRKEADFVLTVMKKYSKETVKSILSVGCGTCSHEVIIAKKKYEITGVDASKTMLKVADKKIESLKLSSEITLLNNDMRNLKTIKKHDFTMAMFNVFGYMTENDYVLKMLSSVRKNLKKGGIFLFDLWHAPAVLSDRPTDRVKEVKIEGGRIIRITKTNLDVIRSVLDINFHVFEIKKNIVKKEVKETHKMRYFSIPEIELFLTKSGFELVDTCNFLDMESNVDGSMWDISVISRSV